MKFSLKGIFVLVSVSLVFLSCNEDRPKSKPVNNSVGLISEINITTDHTTYDYLKVAFLSNISVPQVYLSPPEAFYKINFIGVNSYVSTYTEYQLQLIIVTEENKHLMQHLDMMFEKMEYDSLLKLPQVSFVKKQNVWAKNQSIFFLFGPSAETIRLYLNQEKQNIQNALYKSEIKDYAARACNKNHPLSKVLANEFGIGLAIPDFFEMDIVEKDFFSANWEEGDANCNLLIKVLPVSTDTTLFEKEKTLIQRDLDGKKYLQMDSNGLYLGTSFNFPHYYQTYSLNGFEGSKINGYWVIQGMFRGGPFVRYTVYHPPSGKWLIIEGLVYYPNLEEKQMGKTKTRYMRTLEAIIHTLQ